MKIIILYAIINSEQIYFLAGDIVKKAIRKIFAGFLSLVLVVTTMFALGINVVSAATSGQCTTTINWSYNAASKTLTLTGTGVMPDYRATNIGTNKKSPWEENKIGDDTIKSIMENLVVGEGITEIGEYNFFNCTKLKSVQLPSTLKSIDGMGAGTDLASASYGAFQNCESLTELALPDGLTTIEPYAFKNCKALKSITFPNSLTTLGKCAFLLCSALETVTFGTGFTTVNENAFNSCGVKRINWGSITDIGNQAFYSCNIKDIEFPDQIKSVGNRAFANNTSLMTVKVNNSSMEFKGTNSNTSNNFSGSNQSVTIIGHSASTAQTFANSYGYTFVSMDSCDHTNTRTEIVKDPTCTEAGEKKVICNDCDFVVSDTAIEPLGHDFVLAQETDSTMINGHIYRAYECSRCDATNETVEHQQTVNLSELELGELSELGGIDIGNLNIGNVRTYVWVDGYYTVKYTKEPTCTESGLATFTCTVDGCVNALGRPTTETVLLSASHKVNNWVETPATCTVNGSKKGTCSVCGEKIEETIKATGHSYDENDFIDMNLEDEDGHSYYYFRCKNCAQVVEEKEHIAWVEGYYERTALTRATCTIPGLAQDKCKICGETRTQIIEATGEHEYVEESRTEPDCTKRGTITYKCQNCDQTRTEYLEALGHDYVVNEEQNATCTESGKRISTCSRCSASRTDTLPAKGHTPDESTYEIITAPTCTKTGLAVAVCSVCGEAYETTVDALGHDYQDAETDLTSDGRPGHVLAIPTCTRCGATDSGRIVHKEWIEGYYETSENVVSTCTTGYVIDSCTVRGCNARRTTTIEGLGHSFFYTGIQTYEGVSITCSHCLTTVTVDPEMLRGFWENGKYINKEPQRTETDNSGYLDLDRNGIINAKDYARIVKLCNDQKKLVEEHDNQLSGNYSREYLDGGELTLSTEGASVVIEENEGAVTPGYVFTFTPAESGVYDFYSSGVLDTMAYFEAQDGETWLIYDDNSGTLRNFRISYECEAGVTYLLKTGFLDPEQVGTYTVYAVSQNNAEAENEYYSREYVSGGEVSTGGTGTAVKIEKVDGAVVPGYEYTFTPAESGTYNFYSIGTNDTMAFLEADGAETWAVFDDNGGVSNNFRISYECQAGVTYKIKTGIKDPEATGTYMLYIIKNNSGSSGILS